MTRHPIYLVICIAALIYLCAANTNAWSFWQGVSSGGAFNNRGSGHASFHHK